LPSTSIETCSEVSIVSQLMKTYARHVAPDEPTLDKVIVPLDRDSSFGFSEEALWARQVAEGLYELQNAPFFARGFSFLDVVITELRDGRLIVTGTSRSSGRSTYRAFVRNDASQVEVEKALGQMKKLRCTFESYVENQWTLYAFDVQCSVVDAAYTVLETAEAQGVWDFDEGHFGGRVHWAHMATAATWLCRVCQRVASCVSYGLDRLLALPCLQRHEQHSPNRARVDAAYAASRTTRRRASPARQLRHGRDHGVTNPSTSAEIAPLTTPRRGRTSDRRPTAKRNP